MFADVANGLNDDIVLILEYLSGDSFVVTSEVKLNISGGDLYSRIMNSEEVFTEADISQFIKQIILGRENTQILLTMSLFTRATAHPSTKCCSS